MPVFRCTIEKFITNSAEYFTNVYHVNAADIVAAIPLMDAIVAAEAAYHYNFVTTTKGRVDDMVVDTPVFRTKVYNTPGGVTYNGGTMGDVMPLYVTSRIDFGSTAADRPSRKFYRGVLAEADVSFTAFSSAFISRTASFIVAMIGTGYVDQQGNDINSGALFPMPAMRQLRRGSKKKRTLSSGTPM